MKKYKPIVSLLIVLFIIHTTVFAETFVNIMDFNKWRIDAVESYTESSLTLKEYGEINCSNKVNREVFEQLLLEEKILFYIGDDSVSKIKTKGCVANICPLNKSFVLSVKAIEQSQIIAVTFDDNGKRENMTLVKTEDNLFSSKFTFGESTNKVRLLEWENFSSIKPVNSAVEYTFSEDDIKTMNEEIKDNSTLAIVTGTAIMTNEEGERVVIVEFIQNGENCQIELPAEGNETEFVRGSIFEYESSGDGFVIKGEIPDTDKKDVVLSEEDLGLIPMF